jgi:hypothetical protein
MAGKRTNGGFVHAGRGGACLVNPLSGHPVATDSRTIHSAQRFIVTMNTINDHQRPSKTIEYHADSQLPTTLWQLHVPSQYGILQSSRDLQRGRSFVVWGASRDIASDWSLPHLYGGYVSSSRAHTDGVLSSMDS